ncbi:MAG: hypothetical protein JKY59_02065 [Emcibacter sp.]|nr:hypothetical protein [Emcibacter sp.]
MSRFRRRSRQKYRLQCDQIANPLTIKPRYGLGPGIIALLALSQIFLVWLFSIGHLVENDIVLIVADFLILPLWISDLNLYGIWFPRKRD